MASPRCHCGDTAARGPGPGQVLVEVRAAGIQPGEVHIRTGELHERWPATFLSGQGSDLAGVVVEVGSQVRGVAAGDEVLGFTHDRASHAEFVVVDDVALTSRPVGLPWDVAGSLYVAGTTAYATVFAVDPDRPTRSSSPVRLAASGRLPCSSRGGAVPR